MKKLILTTTALALSASMAFAGGHGKTVRMGEAFGTLRASKA